MSKIKAIIILTLVMAIAAVAISLDTCGKEVTEEVTTEIIISTEPGQTVSDQTFSVSIGQLITISLEANATTGFEWQAEFDDSFLKLIKDEYEPPLAAEENGKPIAGAGGRQTFEFEALKKGTTGVTLVYKQPWEGGDLGQTAIFTFNIN
ncbi:MAG: hypothetical protein COS88_04045 [Chloroflexi bacterium CG07_land_8_20_14_0_80_51_10]|nr:MAG: hypothetical protein COS88_04045 [Chloroflexi bacterium CG07_land_8_20_14_0_80_51_10]